MNNLLVKKFPLLIFVLLLALTCSGIAYALTPQELPTLELSTFHRSFDYWLVTTQAEFEEGVLNGVDTSSSPGDVKLAMPDDWYNASWSRRAPVTISNSGSALTDYQVKVDVTYDADMQSDFDDIRFTDGNGITLLSYWRESYNASTSAVFWVKVPSIPTGDSTIYMYYGNSAAPSASSGDDTFIFYDSFEVDLSKWSEIVPGNGVTTRVTTPGPAHGNYSVEVEDTSSGGIHGIDADFTSQTICVVEFYMKVAQTNQVCHMAVDEAGTYGPQLRFAGDSTVEYKAAGPWTDFVPAVSYSADTWYEFKLTEVDVVDDTYDIYIDGDLKQDDATFHNAVDSSDGIRFVTPQIATPTYYVDLVKVREYADTEPTTSVGTEELVSYISPGPIASKVYDTVKVDAGWDLLGWDKTLPSGTNITFEVRASNTIFNKDAATPAWQDASVLPTGRYQQWRATLTSNASNSETPILHEVWDLYSW